MRKWTIGVLTMAAAIMGQPAAAQKAELSAQASIRADQPGPKVNRQIFGQFAEHLGTGIYGGVWVGEDSPIPNTRGYRNDVLNALRAIKVPVIRWPGGCFADEYHWREGIGAREKRPVKINTHWGGVTEPNTFGTHEFMDFAELVGAEAYVAGNVGSSPPQEMAEWVEYMTSPTDSTLARERWANGRKEPWKLPFFGIGNELWGCGGNMKPEYAANETRRYSTFIKVPWGTNILKFASGANSEDYNWTEVMMRETGSTIDGIALHYYTVPGTWAKKGSATQFNEDDWALTLSKTLKMDELLTKHNAIMDKYDPKKRVWMVVDEWGTWFDQEPGSKPGFLYQQNSLRDALVAAINIDIFVKHADRVKMTNIAQMVNVLQAMILTDGDKMVLTPTYHVFDMYKDWQDATALAISLESPVYSRGEWSMPAVSASAVRDVSGKVHVALSNLDPNRSVTVTARLSGLKASSATGRVLTASKINAYNDFGKPPAVVPQPFKKASVDGELLKVELPARSVVVLDLK